jgi:predicted ATPase with chaperone activity
MDAIAQKLQGASHEPDPVAVLAPRPRTIGDTGLSQAFLADLLSKHLLSGGVLAINQLADRICLPARLLEDLLHFMRQEARVEVLAGELDSTALRYALTDRGRALATNALTISGYAGPAPVPLSDYVKVVQAQTVHGQTVTARDIRAAYHDVVVSDDLLDRIGPSLNSGRAIFIYGPAGTGKTFLTQRIARVFSSSVLIPHAIAINGTVVSLFDPVIHKAIARDRRTSLTLDGAIDDRFVRCQRPAVVVGGELTADMLEIQFDANSREFRAPLQLKANNGLFIIDDMGRQRVEPQAVFQRWIVPLEEKRDYLSLGSGRHFSVPFDMVLVFSTNLKPTDLADEAFLRRIGYKIRIPHLDADQYGRIWRDQCRQKEVPFDADLLAYVVDGLHRDSGVPLLPCHPRDLLGLCVDRTTYTDQPRMVTRETLNWAWGNYFAGTGDHSETSAQTGERQ